ncbi:MAG: arginine--tRNA ligase [Planctomycetota bacterium]
MIDFRDEVLDALTNALSGLDGAPDRDALSKALSHPPDPSKGDLAFPVFTLAKALRKAPPAIAADLATKVATGGAIQRVEAAGPYLNFFAHPGVLLADLLASVEDGSFAESCRSGAREKVMVEFSQPNTHKVFHVGHLRNVAVGDALQRVFRARGHEVVAANYYGDFGVDVAKCLWWLKHRDVGDPPAEERGAWLGKAYASTTAHLAELEANDRPAFEALHTELREILEKIKSGEPGYADLYEETRQWCLDEFAEVYRWLDVRFDTDFYESELEEPGQAIVDEYLERGVFEHSQGAIVCMLDDYDLGPALVRKSDGTSLYLTWDLVLARRKFDEFGVERSLYVVGSEQTYHFKQLFATLERMGYERAKDCRHVAYELVMLPEGKMSSRKGKVIPFFELRRVLREAIETKMREDERDTRSGWSEEKWSETVDRVAVACLRYGMLQVANTTRVIFDVDAWTNLEGESGAYLLYSLARISGIFRRADGAAALDLAAAARAESGFGELAERALLGHLLRYPRVLAQVESTCDPSHLANWLFDGAKTFSRFYHDCPVLKAEPALRDARLALVRATEQVMSAGLRTLGVEPVDAM